MQNVQSHLQEKLQLAPTLLESSAGCVRFIDFVFNHPVNKHNHGTFTTWIEAPQLKSYPA